MSNTAVAQTPGAPMRFVVPFGPGGAPDVIGRLVGTFAAQRAGQAVIFENRPGAGGVVGVNYFASLRNEAASAVVLVEEGIYAVTPALRPSAPIDVARDFRPVSTIAKSPLFILAGPKIDVRTVPEMIAFAKANPGSHYGTPGLGTPHHLVMEYLNLLGEMKLTHVAYPGGPQQILALLGGETAFSITAAPGVRSALQNASGVRVLGVIGARRSSLLPDTPTLQEQGVAGFDGSALDIRFGLMTAASAPDALVAMLNESIRLAVQDPEIAARFEQLGFEPQTGTAEEFRALIQSDAAFFRTVVEKTGIKQE
jgi:tripartite-type tricarboxylate transporter receptor subunit TctC